MSELPRHPYTTLPFPTSTTSATDTPQLPAFDATGPKVDATRCVEPGTGGALACAAAAGIVFAAFLMVTIYGIVIAAFVALSQWSVRRRARATLRGSTLQVGPRQFAPIHACVTTFAQRLGLATVPEVYVVDSGEVNGFALRFGGRDAILLTDETVAACLEGQSPGALAFVVAHELAHLALGHQRWWRRPLRALRWLARLDECSADNVACELVASRDAAEQGVLLLAVGPRLLSYVDRAAAHKQAAEVVTDKHTKRAERLLTHPLALRRLARVAERTNQRSTQRVAA